MSESDWVHDEDFIDDIIILGYDFSQEDLDTFYDEQLAVLEGSLSGANRDTITNKKKNIADFNKLLKRYKVPITVTDLKYEDDYFYWKYIENSRRNPLTETSDIIGAGVMTLGIVGIIAAIIKSKR